MDYIIGLDICGTTSRMKVADMDGRVLGEYNDVGVTLNHSDYSALKNGYRDIIMRNLGELSFRPDGCRSLCLGASGIDSDEIREQYKTVFTEMGFAPEALKLYNDCELLVHVGRGEACVAVVAGTGSVIVGKSSDGRVVRYGGWGHVVSDEGGGYYLAQLAFKKVIHFLDGYGSCRILAKNLLEFTECRSSLALEEYFEENMYERRTIEKLAKLVAKSAAEGDKTAGAILQSAVSHLFHGIQTVAGKIRKADDEPLTVFLSGSVLTGNNIVADGLRELITQNLSRSETGFLQNSAVDIALHIARMTI